jgi:hypothetical protein
MFSFEAFLQVHGLTSDQERDIFMTCSAAIALFEANLEQAGSALCEAGAVGRLMDQLTRLHACAVWRFAQAKDDLVPLIDCFTRPETAAAGAVSELLLALVGTTSLPVTGGKAVPYEHTARTMH